MSVSFVASALQDSNVTSVRTVTIPGTAQTGDVALLMLTRGANETPGSPTGVTGWTALGEQQASSLTTTVWYKALSPTDPGGAVTVTTATSGKATLIVGVWRGVDNTTPIDASNSSSSASASTTRAAPGITTVTDQAWVVEHIVDKSSAPGTAWTAPSGFTKRAEFYEVGTGSITSVLGDTAAGVSIGSHGGDTWTENAPGNQAVMWTIALRPDAGGGPTNPVVHAGLVATGVVSTSQTAQILTFSAGAADGDLLVGSVAWDANLSVLPSMTVTDSQNNFWTVDASDNNGAVVSVAVFSCNVTQPLSAGDTLTLTVDSARNRWATVVEKFTGFTNPGPDVAFVDGGNNTAVSVGPTPVTTATIELIYSGVAWRPTAGGESLTPGGGWSTGSSAVTTAGSSERQIGTAYKTVTVLGTQTFTGTIPTVQFWEGAVVTYRDVPVTNLAPVADPGPDITVNPGTIVTLNATGSFDYDGSIASYEWVQLSGQAVSLSSTTDVQPTFTAPVLPGGTVLVFGLTVTDDQGLLSTQSSVTITVAPARQFESIRISGTWQPATNRRRSGGSWS
jgi:hypothetical protein